jgi:hypothetical protein
LIVQLYSFKEDVSDVDKWPEESRDEVCGLVKLLHLVTHTVR